MGLEFGFFTIDANTFYSFEGDKNKLNKYINDHDDDINYLTTWVGWENPAEMWFKYAFRYYKDYDGVLMRAITPEEIYKVMLLATSWYDETINPKMNTLSGSYKLNKDGSITTFTKIDGIEVFDTNTDTYSRISVDSPIIHTKTEDEWLFNFFPHFIKETLTMLSNINWENNVLLYYVSY